MFDLRLEKEHRCERNTKQNKTPVYPTPFEDVKPVKPLTIVPSAEPSRPGDSDRHVALEPPKPEEHLPVGTRVEELWNLWRKQVVFVFLQELLGSFPRSAPFLPVLSPRWHEDMHQRLVPQVHGNGSPVTGGGRRERLETKGLCSYGNPLKVIHMKATSFNRYMMMCV